MATVDSTNGKIAPSRSSVIKKKFKKYLYYTLALVILIIGIWAYWSYFYTYSDGYRSGVLKNFTHKGTVFKTYEGEMMLGSEQNNTNLTYDSDKFLFSVSDVDVAHQLEQLQGKNVIVHYAQKNNPLPWRGETTFIVSGVKLSN